MTTYATNEQFRAYIRDPSANDDDVITLCCDSASRAVEGFCGRTFDQQTLTQYFTPEPDKLWILDLGDNDLANTTGLLVKVEWGLDGTYPESRVFGTDFICEPINQTMGGIAGWPFTQLRAVNGKIWPPRYADYYRDTVKITGTFGWPAVPDPVELATLVLAAENFKMMDAPFGFVGFGNFGTARVQDNPKAKALLAPYRKGHTLLMA